MSPHSMKIHQLPAELIHELVQCVPANKPRLMLSSSTVCVFFQQLRSHWLGIKVIHCSSQTSLDDFYEMGTKYWPKPLICGQTLHFGIGRLNLYYHVIEISTIDDKPIKNQVTILNERECLSKEEIERMVQGAEKFCLCGEGDDEEDKRITAKIMLEAYCTSMKLTLENEKIKSRICEHSRQIVLGKCTETLAWLDANQWAGKGEFEQRQKELMAMCANHNAIPSSFCTIGKNYYHKLPSCDDDDRK